MTNKEATHLADNFLVGSGSKQLKLKEILVFKENAKIRTIIENAISEIRSVGLEKKCEPSEIDKEVGEFLAKEYEGKFKGLDAERVKDYEKEVIPYSVYGEGEKKAEITKIMELFYDFGLIM